MVNGVILPDQEIAWEETSLEAWRAAVAAHQTTMGYRSWCESQFLRAFSPGEGTEPPDQSARPFDHPRAQNSGAGVKDGLYCETGVQE